MVASVADGKWDAAAAGFTFGFGVLTTWTAIQQTVSIRAPLRNTYLYLVWGELISNLVITMVSLVYMDDLTDRSSKLHIFTLIGVCGIIETQCYLQIIINRASLMGPNKSQLVRIKWGTAILMTILQSLGFAFWYMAFPKKIHIARLGNFLKIFDHLTKAVTFIVDMLLNYWFVRIVQVYLEKRPARYEYTSLCRFNLFLIFLSLIIDVILLGFSSLSNSALYLQFHPVAYMMKLNIEMSVANLVARLTRGSDFDEDWSFIPPSAFSRRESGKVPLRNNTLYQHSTTVFLANSAGTVRSVVTSASDDEIAARRERISGVKATRDVLVTVEEYGDGSERWNLGRPFSRRRSEVSLEGSALPLQNWYSPALSNIALDTRIFDDIP